MRETLTGAERGLVSQGDTLIPPRPDWLPATNQSLPPRPKWLSERSALPASQSSDSPETSIVTDEPLQGRQGDWRQDATAFVVSLAVHLMLLLVVWQMFRFVMQPRSPGIVITSEIDTGEDGAESQVLTLIDSTVPMVQPVAVQHATAVDITPLHIGSGAPGGVEATIGGGGGIGFFGARAEANSVVFVVDKSGSMSNQMRLDTAKLELSNALQQLKPHQKFYVIFYDNDMLRMLAPAAPPRMQFATRSNVSRFLNWLSSHVEPGGGTVPRESLLTALELQPEVIFFLTDGDSAPQTAATVHLQNAQDTIIHTLCFSNDYGEQVMRRIAQENRGRYRFVDADTVAAVQRERERIQQEVLDEQVASTMLQNARRHREQGRSSTSTRLLQKLIDQFPDTPQARQAEGLVQSLNVAE